jgi:hypothetical protein
VHDVKRKMYDEIRRAARVQIWRYHDNPSAAWETFVGAVVHYRPHQLGIELEDVFSDEWRGRSGCRP